MMDQGARQLCGVYSESSSGGVEPRRTVALASPPIIDSDKMPDDRAVGYRLSIPLARDRARIDGDRDVVFGAFRSEACASPAASMTSPRAPR